MFFGSQNFTTFNAVNTKGSTSVRLQAGAVSGTIKADLSEGLDRAWTFPNKSGTFPIMGTFSVQLPAATTAFFSTIVTVSGLRAEDALVVMPSRQNSAAYSFDNGTQHILIAANPGNGQATLYFNNLGNSTGYTDRWYSYLAVR